MDKQELKPDVDRAPYRVRRGGSWIFTADGARAADRNGRIPGHRGSLLGFRLVRDTEGPCRKD